MATNVDLDQMEVTRSERLLALILAIFVLIGALWIYAKLDEVARPAPPVRVVATAEQQRAITALDQARTRVQQTAAAKVRAGDELEVRREAYRTALDAGRSSADLERTYQTAQGTFEAADRAARAAAGTASQAKGPGEQAQRAVEAEQKRQFAGYDRRLTNHGRVTFGLRLGYVLGMLALAYWWFGRVRRSRPRLVPIATATIGAAAIQTFVMAGDYATDYFDIVDLGPIVLSLVGIALTIVAILALQRFIARRVPGSRVRKRECPFCGYPIRDGSHCEGCGREVIAECRTCHEPRRVGTQHCGVCGTR